MYPFYDLTTAAPTLPSMSQNFGANGTLRHNPNVPAIELARQASMAQQGTSPSWPPVGRIGQQLYTANKNLDPTSNWDPSALGGNRPGFMTDGNYYSQPGPPGFTTNLAATINRVNRFDFHAMIDSEGNPFGERLTNYLDDYVNDPRKTEADIKQLLSNIRPDMEVPEEERGETPDALRYPLYPHQQLALKWMMDMEEGTNKGGILADDMGLGKTVSTLALMVSRPAPDNTKVCDFPNRVLTVISRSSDTLQTNLIIGPVALIKQWESEVKSKLKGTHKLSVFLLHSKKKPYSEIKKYDVVLTTYGLLAAEWKRYNTHIEQRKDSPRYEEGDDMELAKKCPILHPRSKFYRIILDEAQCIKNKDTQGSRAVHKINATYRWCLTGTPMMNGVSELYPLIRFLRIRPYCDFTMFQRVSSCLQRTPEVTANQPTGFPGSKSQEQHLGLSPG
jgi:SNF2 family DNA or RNA helicase